MTRIKYLYNSISADVIDIFSDDGERIGSATRERELWMPWLSDDQDIVIPAAGTRREAANNVRQEAAKREAARTGQRAGTVDIR